MQFDWQIVLDVGVGAGIFLLGVGVFVVCLGLTNVLRRLITTLDEIDRQIGALGPPITETLVHVSGIADTADVTFGKLGGIAGSLESITDQLIKTSSVAHEAITPSLINLGSTLSGVTAGLRRSPVGELAVRTMFKDKHSEDQGGGGGLFVWGLLTGALVGTALALAFAPGSGEETRGLLRSKSRQLGDEARESAADASDRARAIAEDLGASATGLYERGKEVVAHARETVDAAIDEAKSFAAEERSRLHQDI